MSACDSIVRIIFILVEDSKAQEKGFKNNRDKSFKLQSPLLCSRRMLESWVYLERWPLKATQTTQNENRRENKV